MMARHHSGAIRMERSGKVGSRRDISHHLAVLKFAMLLQVLSHFKSYELYLWRSACILQRARHDTLKTRG